MILTAFNTLFLNNSKRTTWPSLSPKGQRRLVLWTISVLLIVSAASFLQDSIQQQSLIGIIFSGSWIATILVNSAIVDYMLRQSQVR